MAITWGFFGRDGRGERRSRGGRRSRGVGGEHLLAHLEQIAGTGPEEISGELAFSEEVAVLVYRVEKPFPHLLYVTYGLSRTRSSAPVAGMQDELTLRVPAEAIPPSWPVQRLRRLASYQRASGYPIEPGHYMDLGSPVCGGATLTGFIFVADPLIPLLAAPTGRVRFINAVPVTADELDAALRWDPLKFAGLLGDVLPLGVGKQDRASLLIDASFARPLTSLTERDGSSIAAVSSSYFAVDATGRIDMTAHAAAYVLRAMKWRLGYGRPFSVVGEGETGWARFVSADGEAVSAVEYGEDSASGPHATVTVNRALRHEVLAVLDSEPGTYRLTSAPLAIHVIDPAR